MTTCRDGSYSQSTETISLQNVTLEDSGFYYCSVRGSEDETRATSLQLQVNMSLLTVGYLSNLYVMFLPVIEITKYKYR